MRVILHHRSWAYAAAALLIGVAGWLLFSVTSSKNVEYTTTTVERGTVRELVSVSGVVEAEQTADLAFPISGIVESVLVKEGQAVNAGDVLVTLQQAALRASRQDALGVLLAAQADRDELISGPQAESRSVTETEIAIAEAELARTIAEQTELVENARLALLSNDLQAYSTDADDEAIAPSVSGTFQCEEGGTYTLTVYRSRAVSGYSFNFTGLESGVADVFTGQAAPFGTCGLLLQFTSGETYAGSSWSIPVPNQNSSTYTTYNNAYMLAQTVAKNKIAAAEQALALALQQQTLENADPREEALQRANAAVMRAQAGLARVNADLTDRTIRAPFAGTVTSVDVVSGETVTTVPIVTLLGNNEFQLTARIPEIDVTKVAIGQPVELIFDAHASEIIPGSIAFISPLATEIEGVAYFEATIVFESEPTWMRAGLNADVDIIVEERTDTLRIPLRFLVTEDESRPVVLVPDTANKLVETPVTVGFIGNDGFVEISGIDEGTTIIAP